ncbi:hypothetical protein J8F10_33220 [Gemmata sp. G18]|uniref:DUF1583 domain-containing protein n=1 Tax=Gemmata palustris TaxID=2822762 RepID=A0ABS5C2B3_9BACT|nr:hypothetical protein [Gemmata palustris]MBP3960113.1 hypothetical protein [Gemmata palustris]
MALAFLVALGPATASAQGAKPLLEDVRDRHRAAIEAIRTVTYSYEWKHLKDEPIQYDNVSAGPALVGVSIDSAHETGPGQYWQSPDAWRTRALWSDGRTVDEVFRFGRLIRAQTAKKKNPDQSLEVTSETMSAFQRGHGLAVLFAHWSRDSEILPFHGLLHQPHKIRSVERLAARSDGSPGEIRVVLENDKCVCEFWFSPKHNYLIRKRIEHPADQLRHRHEDEVSEFVEPNPGQFFPARIERRSFEAGELKQHTRRNLSEVRINRPVPNEAFRIPGIEGCLCDDQTTGTQFRVDADGYRFGAECPIPPTTIHQMAHFGNPTHPASPPVSGDQSTVFWLGVTITVLVLGLCVAIFEIRWLRAELRKRPVPKLSGN